MISILPGRRENSIAVFVAVYGFLICGLASITDTHFIEPSFYQCSVAFAAIVSVLHLARPSEHHRRALSIVCAEVLPCAQRQQTVPIQGPDADGGRSRPRRSGIQRTRDPRKTLLTPKNNPKTWRNDHDSADAPDGLRDH
jgi:hypothetical protein